MSKQIAAVDHDGKNYQGKWSGSSTVPYVGQEVSGFFGADRIPGKVVGYFIEHGYLGCKVQVLRLPQNLHEFGKFLPGAGEIKSALTFQQCVTDEDAFTAYFFGVELKDPTPYKFPEHDALEEFAVLVAAASYGRNTWRHNLEDCWINGNYWNKSYNFFSGELQRVRNDKGRAFVDYVVSRNQKWVAAARRALK